MKAKALAIACASVVFIVSVSACRGSSSGGLRVRALRTAKARQVALVKANLLTERQPQLLASYRRVPLGFEANQGQTDRRVKFLSRASGYTLFLTPNETLLSFNRLSPTSQRRLRHDMVVDRGRASNNAITGTVLRMRLVGANAAAEIS